jgi:MoaA/NifB/PqqE/SkfB family radical SAM enzyme
MGCQGGEDWARAQQQAILVRLSKDEAMRADFYVHLVRRILTNNVRARLGFAAIPYKLLWNATYHCNSRCQTCNIWQIYPQNGGSQNHELGRAEVRRIVASLGKHLLWLAVTGGEPTLKPHVVETVNDIYDACPRLGLITVNTNAILPKHTVNLFEGISSHCRRAQVVACLSLDGVGKLHDEIRGVPGNFEAVLETRDRLKEWKKQLPNLRVAFLPTISRHNLHHIPELLEFCRSQADEHMLTFAQEAELYRNHGGGHDITTDRHSFPRVLEELGERFSVRHVRDLLQWSHLRLMRYFVEHRRVPVPCTAGSSTMTLGPTGEVSGCLFLDNSMGNAESHGYDLMRLLRTERARTVQRNCSNCHRCWTCCESFPSMMSSPLTTLGRILTPRSKELPAKESLHARC